MTDASRAFRLQVALSAIGAAVVAATAILALSRVRLDPAAVAVSCSQFAPSLADLAAAIVLVLPLVGTAVSIRVVWSLAKQTRQSRRALRRLRLISPSPLVSEGAVVFEEAGSVAFCAGLLRPRIYVSTGALDRLEDRSLQAVLAHERHHARRRDPFRVLVTRSLADALFFLPALRRLAERYADLAEVAADEAAIRDAESRRALASALVVFDSQSSSIAPERVDRLLGTSERWQPPLPLLVGAIATITSLAVVGAVLAVTTSQASIDLPAMVSHVCVVMLTALLTALALLPLRR